MIKYYKDEEFTEQINPTDIEKLPKDAVEWMVKNEIIYPRDELTITDIDKLETAEDDLIVWHLYEILMKASRALNREGAKNGTSMAFAFDFNLGKFYPIPLSHINRFYPVFMSLKDAKTAIELTEPFYSKIYGE